MSERTDLGEAPASSFYEPAGDDVFAPTIATAGPWSAEAQHGGPPSALLTRAIEAVPGGEGRRLARMSVDILGSVPVEPLEIEARVIRPGRSVELVEAVAAVAGRPMLVARGWRYNLAPDSVPPTVPPEAGGAASTWTPPETLLPPGGRSQIPGMFADGYIAAIEWRMERGSFAELGPARVWARQRVPLLPGEEPSPWQRTLLIADSGNGLSFAYDPARWPAINSEITVTLFRDPVGPWIHVKARSEIEPGAGATATTHLGDRRGRIGTGLQSLLVRELAPPRRK